MKINVVAVGKIKETYLNEALTEYSKRISRYADFTIVEVPDAPPGKNPEEQRVIESARLLEKCASFVIALDSGGKEVGSEQLAELIRAKCTAGVSEFSFLIGGSHGHAESLKSKADMLLSFGRLTFPHQLFRVMLSEQIYRALCINANTPYHK